MGICCTMGDKLMRALMIKGSTRLTEDWDTPVSNLPLKGSRGQKSKVGEDLDVWWKWA